MADTAGMHSDTTNPSRITEPVAGTYAITVKKGTLYLGSSINAGTSSLLPLNTVATVARRGVDPLGAGRATRRGTTLAPGPSAPARYPGV